MSFTHIYFLLDSSGSMSTMKEKIICSMNEFLIQQCENSNCFVSLYTFSENLELISNKIHIQKVSYMTEDNYITKGSTALYDAIGNLLQNITLTCEKNVVIILTDGEENSSMEFTRSEVQKLIESFKDKIKFIFIGSNQDAIFNGKLLGIQRESSLTFSDDRIDNAIRSSGEAVLRYSQNYTEEIEFTDVEREHSFSTQIL
jgi:uncharacterized protein with von Willebrand factor type A (vWA) domain